MATLRREAIEHFEKALEIDPSNTTLRFQLVDLHEEIKLPWRVCLHYEKVLDVDANNIKAQQRLRFLDAGPGKNGISKRPFIDRIFNHSPK